MVSNNMNKKNSKEKRLIQVNTYDQDYVCLMGKNITSAELQKRMKRKPRLFGTILMNLFIIIVIVIAIILVIGF